MSDMRNRSRHLQGLGHCVKLLGSFALLLVFGNPKQAYGSNGMTQGSGGGWLSNGSFTMANTPAFSVQAVRPETERSAIQSLVLRKRFTLVDR